MTGGGGKQSSIRYASSPLDRNWAVDCFYVVTALSYAECGKTQGLNKLSGKRTTATGGLVCVSEYVSVQIYFCACV